MIKGIGCDIVEVSRFEKWIETSLVERFFNPAELIEEKASLQRKSEYYAIRYAAKEAFSKALGTGLSGFSLKDVYIKKDANGKPSLIVEADALKKTCELFGDGCIFHVSLSHEKKYAIAYVIIEK
ncbi:MAG: holo-ACP synthase [Treponema sp.]|nr:holo-ACP synthase [Treponema sp.]